MSVRVMSAAWAADLPPSEKLVLLALADCANDEGGCWPSATTIADKSGLGERTVRRAIQALIAKRHLSQRQRSGTSPMYTIHPCQCGTPANAAPLPMRPDTPANAAPKPSRTIRSKKDKPSSRLRAKWNRPDDIPDEEWRGFEEMRNRIGKPMTNHARDLAVKRLRSLAEDGWPPGQVLNHCTLNGYQGIFPPKDNRNGHSPTAKPAYRDPILGDALEEHRAGMG